MDKIQTDRRGGVLRLTGDIRRNVAYTTNAHIVQHVTTAFGTGNQEVHLHLDATEGGKSLLLNITPRLGFNRYRQSILENVNKTMKLIRYERERFVLDIEEIAEHDRPPMVEIPEYGERL